MLKAPKHLAQFLLTIAILVALSGCQSIATVKDVPWNKQNSLFVFEEELIKKILRLDKKALENSKNIFVQLEFPETTPKFCQREKFFRHLQNAILKSRRFEFLFPLKILDEASFAQTDWRLVWQVKEKAGYCDWNGVLKNDIYQLILHSSYTRLK